MAASPIQTNKDWLDEVFGRELCGFAYVRGLTIASPGINWPKPAVGMQGQSRKVLYD
jgi:hypothetical protein